ncbi:MAG: cell division transport system permease protein [Abditibacteriota bacterium]|nr:cell division transport system permease protein [Abditibacteriota bacterium]
MPLEFLMFWTRETFSNIRRNRVMSLLAISTVTVGLFILGAFYLTLSNFRAAVKSETEKLDLAVILKKDISESRRKELARAARIPQVKEVEVVLQSEVLKEFSRDMPQIPLEDFRDSKYNPFGDELRLKLHDPAHDFIKVRNYFNSLKGKGVLEIRSPGENEVVQTLVGINRFLTVAGFVALWVMGLAILLIIHNAIRLTIFARRREIRIMELVGATPWFIRIPFMLEGVVYGAVGAIVASLVLGPLYATAARALSPWAKALLPLEHAAVMMRCVGWMTLAGLSFGLLGAWFSLARTWNRASQI